MNHRPFTLLIADDEAIILRGLADSIPWDSINVRVVAREADGLAALRALEEHRPDIAVVDICMPHCDGLTMIERAAELGLDTSFIILSGYDDFTYAQRAIRSGVAAYLLKPINKQELMNAVAEQCARRAQGESADPPSKHEPSYSQLLADIAVGHARDEAEIRAAFSLPESPLPFEGSCVILVKCPLQMHGVALQALEDVLFICPHAVFLQELDQIDIAVHITSSSGGIDNLKKLLREYVALLRARGISAVASMGTYAATLLELPLSLRAAHSALQYALYELPDGVYDAAVIDFTPLTDGGVNRWQTTALADAILTHNEQGIRQEVDAFFASLFYVPMPPPSYIMGMCSYMLMDVQQRLLPYTKDALILPVKEAHARLYSLASMSALKRWLCETLVGFSGAIAESGLYRYAPIIDKAKAFIDQNLLQKLLLSDVAEHVHLSESYLAAMFRSYTGQSFRQYLLERKMEKARELLLVEHKSISDVAELLGYEDYRAFTRAFKKQTGHRPSEMHKRPGDEGQARK